MKMKVQHLQNANYVVQLLKHSYDGTHSYSSAFKLAHPSRIF